MTEYPIVEFISESLVRPIATRLDEHSTPIAQSEMFQMQVALGAFLTLVGTVPELKAMVIQVVTQGNQQSPTPKEA